MSIIARTREILSDPERVTRGTSRRSDGVVCAAGALIDAAGGLNAFRRDVDRDFAIGLTRAFLDHGREAALAYLDARDGEHQ